MKTIKNVLILVGVLIASYITAPYFGSWYDKLSPQYGSAFWGPSREDAVFFAGFLLCYVFFVPFFYGLWGIKENKYWITVLLLPIIWLWFEADRSYIYIPFILIGAGLLLAKIIRLVFVKIRRPNLPIIVK